MEKFKVKIELLDKGYRTIKQITLELPDPKFREKLVLIKHRYLAHIAALKEIEGFNNPHAVKQYRYFGRLHYEYVHLYFMPREAMQLTNKVIETQKRLNIDLPEQAVNEIFQLAQRNFGKRRNRFLWMCDSLKVENNVLILPQKLKKTPGLEYDLIRNKVIAGGNSSDRKAKQDEFSY